MSDVEDAVAFESRFAAVPGITAALREDREIIHVAALGMTAVQVHAIAVQVIADAAEAWANLDHAAISAIERDRDHEDDTADEGEDLPTDAEL